MKLFFKSIKSASALLCLFCLLSGCGNNQKTSITDHGPEQESTEAKNEVRQQTQAETEEQSATIRTITKYFNGQEYLAYHIDPPLLNVPLSEIMERADAGEPAAISELGRRYIHGQGVPRNLAKGYELGEIAAEKGDVDALNDLGLAYLDGIYLDKNPEKAVEYFKKAADRPIMKI
jgi:TPR repeat protein